jgi:hypothetical protein
MFRIHHPLHSFDKIGPAGFPQKNVGISMFIECDKSEKED